MGAADNTVPPIIIGVVDNASAALGAIGSAFSSFAGVISGGMSVVSSFSAVLAPLYYGLQLAKMGFDAVCTVVSTMASIFGTAVDAVVSMGEQLFSLAQNASQTILSLKEMSIVVGMQPTQFQAWAEAAAQVGVSSEQLTVSMRILAQHVEQNTPVFQKLGIAVKDSAGTMRSESDIFQDVATKLGAMGSSAEATALAAQLMGRSGAAMLPVFAQGASVLQTANDRIAALGTTMTEASIKGAEQFRSAWVQLNEVIGAFAQRLGADLMPAFTVLMQQLQQLGMSLLQSVDIAGLGELISDSILQIVASIPWQQIATDGAAAINTLISWVSSAAKAFADFITQIPWAQLLTQAENVGRQVAAYLTALPRQIVDNLPSFVDSVAAAIQFVIEGIQTIAQPIIAIGTVIGLTVSGAGKAVAFLGDAVTIATSKTIDFIVAAVDELLGKFAGVASYFGLSTDAINGMRQSLEGFISGPLAEMTTDASAFFDSMNTGSDQMIDATANIGNTITSGLNSAQDGIASVRTSVDGAASSAQNFGLGILNAAGQTSGLNTALGDTNSALKTAILNAIALQQQISAGQKTPMVPVGASPGGGGGFGGMLPTGGGGFAGPGGGGTGKVGGGGLPGAGGAEPGPIDIFSPGYGFSSGGFEPGIGGMPGGGLKGMPTGSVTTAAPGTTTKYYGGIGGLGVPINSVDSGWKTGWLGSAPEEPIAPEPVSASAPAPAPVEAPPDPGSYGSQPMPVSQPATSDSGDVYLDGQAIGTFMRTSMETGSFTLPSTGITME